MILKGSQRGGARQLATHLLNDRDNDHVTVEQLRGFVSGDLHGAMAETEAIAKGTNCRQSVFSLSLNPPKDASVDIGKLVAAADRAEETLGLHNQPRAIVIHEKEGRMHAHAVWSRISADEMKAINLPFFKRKLGDLSRDLYLEHGWELPEGHRTNGWKNPLNFTLAEWQQAKRLGMDPREIKQVFQSAWSRSDNLASFRGALEEHGYFLAQGDRRGIVAVDMNGEVYSVARMTAVRTKALSERIGDGKSLPGVESVQASIGSKLRDKLKADREERQAQLMPLKQEKRLLLSYQRKERATLIDKQEKRRTSETKVRADRFRRGFGAVLDILTGRVFSLRKQNEAEAYAAFLRDRAQRDDLFKAQRQERSDLQKRIEKSHKDLRGERAGFIRFVAKVVTAQRAASKSHKIDKSPNRRDWDLSL